MFPLRSHSIRFSTGTYSFKLETDYNFCNEVKEGVSAIQRFDWSHENICHSDVILVSHWLSSACRFLIIEYVSNYSVLNLFNLVNILSAKGPKRKPHIQLGDRFCIQFVPFYLSYVGTGRPTKTLCVTEHAPVTSLKVSIINFISWKESWLLKAFYAISVTRALSRTSWMFVVKQVPVCNFILFIFACVVLRKVHVHSLFTLETVGFPECLLFLDSDKRWNQ